MLRVVIEHPVWWILATVALTSLALVQIVDPLTGTPRLLLDSSTASLLPEDDEHRRYFDRLGTLFDTGETLLIAVVADDVFTPENLERIQRITERVETNDFVLTVSSLSTALNIRGSEGELLIEPFFEDVPTTPDAIAALRARALADPIYAGNLVSRDGRISVIAVRLMEVSDQELIDNRVDEAITAILEEERGDTRIWVAGGARVKAELSRLMLADLAFILPVSISLMGLVAFFSFRTIRGVVVPLATIALAVTWTMAWIARAHGQLNQVTVAAPPVLVVVGFAYSIHLLSAYYGALRKGAGRRAVSEALHEVAVPVVFTGITTAAGFMALTTSPLAAIQQFGAFCSIGVVVTMLLTLGFTPALLTVLPAPRRIRAERGSDRFDAFLSGLAAFDLRQRRHILTAGAVVAVLAALGMTRIEVGTDMVSNFLSTNPVRQHFEAINEHLEGANAVTVAIESSVLDAWKEPQNLRALADLQRWLAEQPEVGGTTSFADYLKTMNQALRDGSPEHFAIPDSSAMVSQLLVIAGNDELERYVDGEFQVARLVVRTSAMDSASIMDLVRRIEARALEVLPRHLEAHVTGNSVLLSRTMDDVAFGQALSLWTAFAIIYVILVVLFTSFRTGLLALIPNALPVLIYFGVLGWSGVTLNTTTGLVACLVLGIAVDDTIHLLSHFNTAAKRYASESKGVVEALVKVGRPVTYTTSALCIGFMTLLGSQMRSQVDFGVLAAFTLAVAWLVDVTFTPALAARMRIVSLWDVITLDLGASPERSIPLFAGLRPGQARVAALMMQIRTLGEGETLFEAGQKGDDMYVVIDGRLDATVMREGRRVQLRSMTRGDVVGEVGLFRGERSADVRCGSAARLLRLTQPDLERLKRRHPRIGAQVYANLSRALANRLVSLTDRLA